MDADALIREYNSRIKNLEEENRELRKIIGAYEQASFEMTGKQRDFDLLRDELHGIAARTEQYGEGLQMMRGFSVRIQNIIFGCNSAAADEDISASQRGLRCGIEDSEEKIHANSRKIEELREKIRIITAESGE